MHRRKTGALIQCSVLLGAAAAGVQTGPKFEALKRFGADIGLAFQIQDDILDIEGETDGHRQVGRRRHRAWQADLSEHHRFAGCASARRRSCVTEPLRRWIRWDRVRPRLPSWPGL